MRGFHFAAILLLLISAAGWSNAGSEVSSGDSTVSPETRAQVILPGHLVDISWLADNIDANLVVLDTARLRNT